MNEDIRVKFRAFIEKSLRRQDFEDDTNIFDSKIATSLFGVELVAFVEREFDLMVEDEDLNVANFQSVEALTVFVSGKQANRE